MDADGSAGVVVVLPDDILADILRRLRAHSLARCRCVRTSWRDLVDARGLLPPHALPRAFPGFFANVSAKSWRPGPAFLPPPAARAPAVDRLAFLRPHLQSSGGGEAVVQHHCNGLLLCFEDDLVGNPRAGFVCNPTTERWARLPPPPTWWPRGHDGLFLAFDPAASPDYEVFLLPVSPRRGSSKRDGGLPEPPTRVTLGMFVPKSFGTKQQQEPDEKLVPLLAFSSATGRWSRRLFEPRRCAPARLYDKVTRRRRRSSERDHPWARTWRSAVHRRGSLYAHCERHVLVVLRCSKGTYDMVRLPGAAGTDGGAHYASDHVLSRLPVDSIFPSADDGVLLRYARVDVFRVKVWALQESAGDGKLEWTLTHDNDLAAHARLLDLLHHAPSNCVRPEEATTGGGVKCVWFSDEDREGVGNGGEGDGCCSGLWNWDDASLLDLEVGEDELVGDAGGSPSPFSVLGCHPSEEVVYLAAGAFHIVAYHLGSGKVRYLGRVMSLGDGDRVEGAFPYRPCVVDALPPYSCPFPCLKTANKASLIGQQGPATRDNGQPSEIRAAPFRSCSFRFALQVKEQPRQSSIFSYQ